MNEEIDLGLGKVVTGKRGRYLCEWERKAY